MMNPANFAFMIVSGVVFAVLSFFIIMLIKGKSSFKKELLKPIVIGLFIIPFYCIFILTENHFVAMLFNSLFYACTDWLAFFMLVLVYKITDRKVRFKRLRIFFVSLTIADTISMILNAWFNHTYDIYRAEWIKGWYFWKLKFYPLHYVHLGLCYVFVMATFVILIYEIYRTPKIYKSRYVAILSMYSFVLSVNMICYSMNLPFDVSIILYSLQSAFICYFSDFMIPKMLVTNSLKNFNLSIADAIICFDVNNRYLYSNPAAEKLFEYDGAFAPVATEKFRERMVDKFAGAVSFFSDDEVFYLGEIEVHCSVEYQDLKYKNVTIGSYLKLQDKTQELNQLFKEHYSATHDQLTGIYNREYFFEVCDKKIKENPDTKMIMIASNIRDFKLINSLFGSRKGDEVLCREADMLRNAALKNNIYGRITDDKFALMMRQEDFVLDAFIKATKILSKMIESSIYQIRITMGICEFTGRDEKPSVAYDKALLVMQSLSDDYQQMYAYYDNSIMKRILREKQVTSDFELALVDEQFEVCLDSITGRDGTPKSVATYVRWNHPEKGVLRHEYFIPILEKTGSMYKLDLYIWEKVIATAKEWTDKNGLNRIPIAFNVSESDFYYLDVAEELITLVKKYGVNPGRLIVSFSEGTISRQFKNAKECIAKLKSEGFNVAIKDFGRDISSLKMIESISANILSVDMGLLDDREGGKRGRVILEFIIAMVRELGMFAVAREIKSEEQYKMLLELGFDYFQNYGISEAFTIKDYEMKYLNFAD